MKIAIIMTVYNRWDKTKKCIESILNNNIGENIDFFITNDGSTDATSEILNKLQIQYPKNNFWIYNGSGNFFWAKGMYIAYGEALKHSYDFYMWVNDDVTFFDGFIENMLSDYFEAKKSEKLSIITGATKWEGSNKVSYGGGFYKNKVSLNNVCIEPNGKIQECINVNGNCLLISSRVAKEIGNIDSRYEHSFGDYDYGYRLLQIDGNLYVSSNFVGECDRNNISGSWLDNSLKRKERIRLLHSKKGLPKESNLLFLKKWFPKSWIFHYTKPYIRIAMGL